MLGGDRREEVLIKELAQKGFVVSVLKDSDSVSSNNIEYYQDIEMLVKGADVIIAPMSGADEKGFLNSAFIAKPPQLDKDFFKLLRNNTLFLIGIARPVIKAMLEDRKIKYIEMAKLDELAILNAIPTAEGALQIAIEETDFTIFESRVLIYGLGKVGLTLAWRLKALGAETYAVTRSRSACARGKDLGLKLLSYSNLNRHLSKMNIIFNTVPAPIINKKDIKLMQDNTLIIDLASSPGGVDFKAAQEKEIRAIMASGLPGKVAPITAGKIMSDLISDIINTAIDK